MAHCYAGFLNTRKEFSYKDAQAIYSNLAKEDETIPEALPMTEEDFKAALNPVSIVQNRKVKGGPQDAEMRIMFAQAHKELDASKAWTISAKTGQSRRKAE